MKLRYFLSILLGIVVSNFTSAQEHVFKEKAIQRPLLFADFPSKLNCKKTEVEKIIHSTQFENVSIQVNSHLVLTGQVLENFSTAAGVRNINVRLSNFNNALLHLSIIALPNNKTKTIGRIIHPAHADVLIISEENGSYYLTKQKMELFMVE